MNAIYEMSRIASRADVLGASSLRYPPPPGGEGCSTNFYTGRLRPAVQPLALLSLPFFKEKVVLSYTFYVQIVPLSHTLFRTLHPF